jgi:hypothetical protein
MLSPVSFERFTAAFSNGISVARPTRGRAGFADFIQARGDVRKIFGVDFKGLEKKQSAITSFNRQ